MDWSHSNAVMGRERRRRLPMVCAALTLLVPTPATAQVNSTDTWRRGVGGGLAVGHVYRFEDTTFGNSPTVALSAGIRHRSGFGMNIEWSRTFGLTPAPAPCGIVIDGVPAQCVGQGRDGVEAATVTSVGVRYEFTGLRFRPYLTAGLGILRSASVWSSATVDGKRVILSEQRLRDTGFGPDLGVGMRVAVSPHVAILPEISWLDASVRSRVNLGVTRVGARAAYEW